MYRKFQNFTSVIFGAFRDHVPCPWTIDSPLHSDRDVCHLVSSFLARIFHDAVWVLSDFDFCSEIYSGSETTATYFVPALCPFYNCLHHRRFSPFSERTLRRTSEAESVFRRPFLEQGFGVVYSSQSLFACLGFRRCCKSHSYWDCRDWLICCNFSIGSESDYVSDFPNGYESGDWPGNDCGAFPCRLDHRNKLKTYSKHANP